MMVAGGCRRVTSIFREHGFARAPWYTQLLHRNFAVLPPGLLVAGGADHRELACIFSVAGPGAKPRRGALRVGHVPAPHSQLFSEGSLPDVGLLSRFGPRTLATLLARRRARCSRRWTIVRNVPGQRPSRRRWSRRPPDSIREGEESIAEAACGAANSFPPIVTHMIAVGEKRAVSSSRMLERRFPRAYERAGRDAGADASPSLLEPLMIVFMGGRGRISLLFSISSCRSFQMNDFSCSRDGDGKNVKAQARETILLPWENPPAAMMIGLSGVSFSAPRRARFSPPCWLGCLG